MKEVSRKPLMFRIFIGRKNPRPEPRGEKGFSVGGVREGKVRCGSGGLRPSPLPPEFLAG
jgi:hypothetical protein